MPTVIGHFALPTPLKETGSIIPRIFRGDTYAYLLPPSRRGPVEWLQECGYRVRQAPTGSVALTILESDAPIDLLLTDVGLPEGLDGRQVADAALLRRPALPVLLMTGYAEQTVAGEQLVGEGMELMTKPFDLQALAAKIARCWIPKRIGKAQEGCPPGEPTTAADHLPHFALFAGEFGLSHSRRLASRRERNCRPGSSSGRILSAMARIPLRRGRFRRS